MAASPQSGTQNTSRGEEQTATPGPVDNAHVPRDEESPLLGHSDDAEPKVKALTSVGTIIAVLLLGTKISPLCYAKY